MTKVRWQCQYCEKTISDGNGYIYMDKARAYEVRQAVKQWKADRASKWLSGDDLLSYPEAAKWVTCHRACDPDAEGNSYWVDVARLRTAENLLSWTAHLMGKNWLDSTNWASIIRAKAGPLS
tara:strand:+ start:328 stop:693 length:366 start_codon:yes stop_codon:yes gene_type:complete